MSRKNIKFADREGRKKPGIGQNAKGKGPLHYMELQRLIPNATPKMLSQQLHDLENNGMIHREVIPEKPPKTVYSLTPFGQSIVPILDAMSFNSFS